MALHLLKLAVGIENIGHLREVQARRVAEQGSLCHITRFMPRRAEQILDGGSLFWVVRNFIRVRQRLLDLRLITSDETGRRKCAFVLDPELVCYGALSALGTTRSMIPNSTASSAERK